MKKIPEREVTEFSQSLSSAGANNSPQIESSPWGCPYIFMVLLNISMMFGLLEIPNGDNPSVGNSRSKLSFLSLQTDHRGSHLKYLRQIGSNKCTKAKQQSGMDEGTRGLTHVGS